MANVLFKRGLRRDFVNLPKDPNTIYFVEDDHAIYLGGEVYSFQGIAITGEGDFVSNVSYSSANKILTIHKSTVGTSESVIAVVQAALSAAVQSITTDRGSAIVVDDTNPNHLKLELKLAEGPDAGNVVLEQCSEGLRANIDVPASGITGVKSGDKLLSLDGSEIESTLTISCESIGDSTYIVLRGVNGVEVSKFDASDFVVEAMIDAVDYNPETHQLHIKFRTEQGEQDVYIDLSDLIDTYSAAVGGGLALENNEFSIANEVDPGTTYQSDSTPSFGDTLTFKSIDYDSHGSITGQNDFNIVLPELSGTVGDSGTLINYVEIDNSGQLTGSTIDIVESDIVDYPDTVPTSGAVVDYVDGAIQEVAPVWEIYGT